MYFEDKPGINEKVQIKNEVKRQQNIKIVVNRIYLGKATGRNKEVISEMESIQTSNLKKCKQNKQSISHVSNEQWFF